MCSKNLNFLQNQNDFLRLSPLGILQKKFSDYNTSDILKIGILASIPLFMYSSFYLSNKTKNITFKNILDERIEINNIRIELLNIIPRINLYYTTPNMDIDNITNFNIHKFSKEELNLLLQQMYHYVKTIFSKLLSDEEQPLTSNNLISKYEILNKLNKIHNNILEIYIYRQKFTN